MFDGSNRQENVIKSDGKKVPSSRLARFSHFGGLAARIAGNMLVEGVKQVSKGQRPDTEQLLLTPKNVEQFAKKLSHLRGAAMKLGQIISMDAGELISPELSAVLARLRSDAAPMPHSQLMTILKQNWGEEFLDHFSQFELRPFAAASIGQVHLARLAQGQKLAVKLQYPGVRDAIGSDVDNVATLLNVSGLLPKELDISNLLALTKQQLQDEADYKKEAAYIAAYQAKLNNDNFELPKVHTQLSNEQILVMHFVEGEAVELAVSLPQADRDRIATLLLELFLQELFEFGLMQTDPNFANFLYQQDTKKLGLLDFGATRAIPETIQSGYLALLKAAIKEDRDAALVAAKQIGFFKDDIDPEYLDRVMSIFDLACEPIKHQGPYDFGSSNLASRARDIGMEIKGYKSQWHTPPVDAIFIHRKLGGLYLLASKLKANVDVNRLITDFLSGVSDI